MVPHMKVEEALHQMANTQEVTFAVAGLPDVKKGERLVVLHTLQSEEKLKGVLAHLPESGLPNLWVPRPDSFFQVDQIPILGTGKLDLRAIKELAMKKIRTAINKKILNSEL